MGEELRSILIWFPDGLGCQQDCIFWGEAGWQRGINYYFDESEGWGRNLLGIATTILS